MGVDAGLLFKAMRYEPVNVLDRLLRHGWRFEEQHQIFYVASSDEDMFDWTWIDVDAFDAVRRAVAASHTKRHPAGVTLVWEGTRVGVLVPIVEGRSHREHRYRSTANRRRPAYRLHLVSRAASACAHACRLRHQNNHVQRHRRIHALRTSRAAVSGPGQAVRSHVTCPITSAAATRVFARATIGAGCSPPPDVLHTFSVSRDE